MDLLDAVSIVRGEFSPNEGYALLSVSRDKTSRSPPYLALVGTGQEPTDVPAPTPYPHRSTEPVFATRARRAPMALKFITLHRTIGSCLLVPIAVLALAVPALAIAAAVTPAVTDSSIWCMAWQESYNNWARSYFGRAQFNGGFPWTDPVSHDLMAQALGHSVDMAQKEQLFHLAPAGVGQNIAMQFGQDTVSECVDAEVWLINSPEHLSNMLNPRFTEQGVGVWLTTTGDLYTTHDFK